MKNANHCSVSIFRWLIIPMMIAVAQTALAQPSDPSKPSSDQSIPIDPRQDPRSTTTTARPGETLSERLGRTDGVIRPPTDLNPDMSVRPPVPNPGTTPVIPPPGSPGGDQRVQPK